MNGADVEREFCDFLDRSGFAVTKSPASGSGTKRDQPDVVAGQDTDIFVFELKSGDLPIYIGDSPDYSKGDEVGGLKRYARAFGALRFIVHRPPGRKAYYLFDPTDLRETTKARKIEATSQHVALLDGNEHRDGWTPDDLTQYGLMALLRGDADAE